MTAHGALERGGVRYVPLEDVADRIGRTRQTIWRWRKQAVIPQGHRDRRGRVFFTQGEFEAIEKYATNVEPIVLPEQRGDDRQLRLFNGGNGPRSGGAK